MSPADQQGGLGLRHPQKPKLRNSPYPGWLAAAAKGRFEVLSQQLNAQALKQQHILLLLLIPWPNYTPYSKHSMPRRGYDSKYLVNCSRAVHRNPMV